MLDVVRSSTIKPLTLVALTAALFLADVQFAAGEAWDVQLPPDVYLPAAGPALTPSRVVWGESLPGGGIRILSADAQGDTRTLLRQDSAPSYALSGRLRASADRLVLELTSGFTGCSDKYCDPPPAQSTILAGTLDSPFQSLSAAPCSSAFNGAQDDVDGNTVVYRDSTCSGGAWIDFGAADPSAHQLPSPVSLPRIAGRFIAWVTPANVPGLERYKNNDIVVYDRLAAAEVYRVRADSLKGGVSSLAVLADGTIVYTVVGDYGYGALAWASPGDPSPHVLREGLYDEVVKVFGRAGGGVAIAQVLPTGVQSVGVLSLDGGTNFIGNALARAGIDPVGFDGNRIAWTSVGCESTTIHVRSLDEPPANSVQTPCPLRLAAPPTARGHAINLALDCTGFGSPCQSAGVVVTARLGGSSYPVVVAKLSGAKRTPALVPLTRAGRRLARRRSRARVTVRATEIGPNGRAENRVVTTVATFRRRPV